MALAAWSVVEIWVSVLAEINLYFNMCCLNFNLHARCSSAMPTTDCSICGGGDQLQRCRLLLSQPDDFHIPTMK
jgi:hypothetical protein